MTSLVLSMEMDYHGVLFRMLDPLWSTWSLLCICGQVSDALMVGCSFLFKLLYAHFLFYFMLRKNRTAFMSNFPLCMCLLVELRAVRHYKV